MNWERDPLWTKARLFFSRAVGVPREDPLFGLWCSIGLEMLARAAVASVSPALLAEPDRAHRNLLHVVHRDSEIDQPKSIRAQLVFDLCQRLFPSAFSGEDYKIALALLNRRNEELHSGKAAFDEYNQSQWLAGFYHACQSLSTVLGETLADLLGEEEAEFAERLLAEDRRNVKTRVLGAIAAGKRVFDAMGPEDQAAAKLRADELVTELSAKRHHRVVCPACSCAATVQGTPFGKEHVTHEEDGEITVRQSVSPSEFSCTTCGLKFSTYAELETAGLGDPYTRRTTSSPEDYYGLINPDDIGDYVEDYIREQQFALEYDNE